MPAMTHSLVTYGILALSWLGSGLARPLNTRSSAPALPERAAGFELPIQRRRSSSSDNDLRKRQGTVSGEINLGNNADLIYTVPIELGSTVTAAHLDTGSSDLWVISDACTTGTCATANAPKLPSSSLNLSGTDVVMRYGDSTTGTQASGPVAFDTATVAGLSMTEQPFVAVNATTNSIVKFGSAGIFGLGFPSGSVVHKQLVTDASATGVPTADELVAANEEHGPLLSRIASTRQLEQSMFSISLQRSTIDIGGGSGTLTVGKLPDGVDANQVTWVPVRLYTEAEGGAAAPSFAPNEVYPSRWEIDIDGVFLDGKKLADSTLPTTGGVNATRVSALIDTGNSLLRGPADVVSNIFKQVSPTFTATTAVNAAAPVIPCNTPVNLAFQIGGKMFPVDPRDFIGQGDPGDVVNCVADNLVTTDAPALGALFRWSLGDPFFRSNLVAFHYGNLTHPSVDPPRIGLVSNVPSNANDLLTQAVNDAQANGGVFESTLVLAPTAQAASEGQKTLTAIAGTATGSSGASATPGATSSNNNIGNGSSGSSSSSGNDNASASTVSRTTTLAYLIAPVLYYLIC